MTTSDPFLSSWTAMLAMRVSASAVASNMFNPFFSSKKRNHHGFVFTILKKLFLHYVYFLVEIYCNNLGWFSPSNLMFNIFCAWPIVVTIKHNSERTKYC